MRVYVAFLLVWGSSLASAQSVPGYLGKRLSISYEAAFFPTFYNTNNPGEETRTYEAIYEGSSTGVSVNYQNHLKFDYALSKRWSIGLDVGYLTSYARPEAHLLVFFETAQNWILQENIKVSAFNTILSFKRFSRHFAPLGVYWDYKVGLVSYSYDDFDYILRDREYTIPSEGGSSFLFGMGYGVNRVVADKVLLSFGIDLNYMLKGYNNHISLFHDLELSEFNPADGPSPANKEALLKATEGRVFSHYLVNFKVGVGLLL